jgi:hypothetical protein
MFTTRAEEILTISSISSGQKDMSGEAPMASNAFALMFIAT